VEAAGEVILYTRAGCHLCEEAKQAMVPVLREFGARLREVDIDTDQSFASVTTSMFRSFL
jgi:glutaredoxin